MNWATGIDMKTGRPIETAGGTLRRDRQAVRGAARSRRRAQLAADELQPAHRARLPPGHGSKLPVLSGQELPPPHARLEHRCRLQRRQPAAGRGGQGADQGGAQGPPRGLGPGRAARGLARAARAPVERRGALDRERPRVPGRRAGRVRRLRRTEGHEALVGQRRAPGSSRHRSPTRRTESSTSRSRSAGAAPSASPRASWRATRTSRPMRRGCSPSSSAARRRCRRPGQRRASRASLRRTSRRRPTWRPARSCSTTTAAPATAIRR